jgi:hypothetical protein
MPRHLRVVKLKNEQADSIQQVVRRLDLQFDLTGNEKSRDHIIGRYYSDDLHLNPRIRECGFELLPSLIVHIDVGRHLRGQTALSAVLNILG